MVITLASWHGLVPWRVTLVPWWVAKGSQARVVALMCCGRPRRGAVLCAVLCCAVLCCAVARPTAVLAVGPGVSAVSSGECLQV
jgi:hypothetical protein